MEGSFCVVVELRARLTHSRERKSLGAVLWPPEMSLLATAVPSANDRVIAAELRRSQIASTDDAERHPLPYVLRR